MSLTTDREKLDTTLKPDGMQVDYLILSDEERAKGFLLPVRTKYRHQRCDTETFCAQKLAETIARDPWFYGGAYCATCKTHFPLSEFRFLDGQEMDPSKWTDEELAAVMERKKNE